MARQKGLNISHESTSAVKLARSATGFVVELPLRLLANCVNISSGDSKESIHCPQPVLANGVDPDQI